MKYITHNGLRLGYKQFGEGKKIVLAFHGFGQNASIFSFLTASAGTDYTLVSVSLFHHENSIFPQERIENEPLKKEEWQLLITELIKQFTTDKVTLLGYSLGGKMCLTLAEIIPEKVEKMILVAPDGVKNNFWNHLASRTRWGKSIFKSIIDNPTFFLDSVRFLQRAGWVSLATKKFVMLNLEKKASRQRVYNVWLTFRLFKPNMNLIVNNCLEHSIAVEQFYGKKDPVISYKYGISFSKKLNQFNGLHILNKGHNLLTQDIANALNAAINK